VTKYATDKVMTVVAEYDALKRSHDDLLTALQAIIAIHGLTDMEADRLSAREAWQGALSRAYAIAAPAIKKASHEEHTS
jgi:hypothetical protein